MIRTVLAVAALFGAMVAFGATAQAAPIAPVGVSAHSTSDVVQAGWHRHCFWERHGHHRVRICR